MSDPEFKHKGNKLGRLIEECGEVLHAAGKCVRFGMDSYNPTLPDDKQEVNSRWLQRELADLEDAIKELKNMYGWE